MQEVFGLHELAVEDAQSFHLRPKVEQYDEGVTFVILRTARYVEETEEVDFGEVAVFVGDVVPDHRPPGRGQRPARRAAAARAAPAAAARPGRPRRCGRSSTRSSTTTRRWSRALERDIEEVEQTVFAAASAPTERIYQLRREVTDFYRAVHPLLTPVEALARGSLLHAAPELREYFRDVADHLALVNEEVAAQRDLLTTILQANMAVISVEQNDVVRKISGWGAIIAVPTFIASFYGMNFHDIPEEKWAVSYPVVVALMVLVAFALHRYFRRSGWL